LAGAATSMIVEALTRALTEPNGVPLHGGRNRPGLFAASAAAKKAAQQCKDENWLQVLCTHKQGRGEIEICAITQKGLAYLTSEVRPKRVLEELLRAVEAQKQEIGALIGAVQKMYVGTETFRAEAEKALQRLSEDDGNGNAEHTNGKLTHGTPMIAAPVTADAEGTALEALKLWQTTHPTEDCRLPELYRQVCDDGGELSIGEFHDALRRLHAEGRIYLHPWTGPLYDMPEPALALMVGHEVAYYASMRQ
jgi:hypothetical protein